MNSSKKRADATPSSDYQHLETPNEQKERNRSLYTIYFTMFLMSLGFSLVLTGVYPYLDKLDPTAGKEFMGFVVAANPLGQMLFSPLVGWWGNKRGSVRLPLMLTLGLFTFASGVYSSLEVIPGNRKATMLAARFLVGVSSANVAVARSYVSAATKLSERTKAISVISLAQVLGFVVGPALQAAVTPLKDEGLTFLGLPLNMYTAAGWINVLMGLLNMALFTPCFFKEHKIAAREMMMRHGKASEKETWKSIKPDYLASWTLILAFFVLVFNFVLLETLGTSLTMDQFAWTKSEALSYMGIIMSVGAILACLIFLAIEPLCRRFEERRVMIWGGFFSMVFGRFISIPWGPDPPVIAHLGQFHNLTTYPNGTEIVGCPDTQEWCLYTPRMTFLQFLIGYTSTAIGYPVGVTLIQTTFSKVLGPRPQGTWMGLLTGSGCASRVLGPIFVTQIYTHHGPYYTFGITAVMMLLMLVLLLLVDDRFVIPSANAPDDKRPDPLADKSEIPLVLVEAKDLEQKHSRAVILPVAEVL